MNKLMRTKHFFIIGALGLPKRNGKLKDLSKFDATFFGVHPKQASYMDPQLRILLELTHEAIIDAGQYFCIFRDCLQPVCIFLPFASSFSGTKLKPVKMMQHTSLFIN